MQIRDTRNGEWYWVNNAVLADPHLTAHQKVVYSSLCTFAGYEEIHPDFELISTRTGKTVSRRSCISAIKKLEEIGYISIEHGGGKGNSNVYVLLKAPKGCNHCTVSKGANGSTQKVQMEAPKGATIAPHIDKIDKDIDTAATTAASIQEGIFLFKGINPSYEQLFKNKTERAAMERLISKWGAEKVYNSIRILPQYLSLPGCPQITTPYQLERKLGQYIAFAKQQKLREKSKFVFL